MTSQAQDVHVRIARMDDLPQILALFKDTILSVCVRDYSITQLQAWASGASNTHRWIDRLQHQYFIVAEQRTLITGFGSLDHGSYIDLLYVHKDYQNLGVATRIFAALEKEAIRNSASILTSDVSITARPFFEKRGFRIVKEQTQNINSVPLINYKMERNVNTLS